MRWELVTSININAIIDLLALLSRKHYIMRLESIIIDQIEHLWLLLELLLFFS